MKKKHKDKTGKSNPNKKYSKKEDFISKGQSFAKGKKEAPETDDFDEQVYKGRDKSINKDFEEKKVFKRKRDLSGENKKSSQKPYNKSQRREETEENRNKKNLKSRDNKKFSKVAKAPEYDQEKLRKLEEKSAKNKGIENDPSKKPEIRLNRYVANAGVCSRREADKLIENGDIKVNNKVITEMGYKVKPHEVVKYKGKILQREQMVYVLLNKPKDHITTAHDPEGRKTVMNLVANASEERIYPVGRLDRQTTGLLLLTNDGDLAHKLAHPSGKIKKVYQVVLDKPLTEEDFEKINEGLTLEDGEVKVDKIAIVSPDATIIGIEIHVGKNRIVRRIFEHLGYEVVTLDRTIYAGLTKKDLPRGKWRFLKEKELINLKYFK